MSKRTGPPDLNYWLTPPDVMEALKAEFNFDFDPCPFPRPAGFDGLVVDWGKRNYVNPPFVAPRPNGPRAWAEKCITESAKGKTCVMVFPADGWLMRLVEAGAEVRNLGNIPWQATDGSGHWMKLGRPIGCFILRGAE